MKKYCLAESAKKDIKDIGMGILLLSILVIAILSFLFGMIFLVNPIELNGTIQLYSGFFGFTAWYSLGAYLAYRWLQKSLIEC